MKKSIFFGVGVSLLFVLAGTQVFLVSQQEERSAENLQASAPDDSLPAVLEDLYPPKAQKPVFFLKMLGLAHSFSGTISDFFGSDLPNALDNFQKFKAQYAELASLVPDWKSEYPSAPVEELGTALKTGDQGMFLAAVEKVGGVCSACHVDNMVRVQQKYGWPDFSAIKAKDPLTGEEVDLHMLMVYLDISFTGLGADLEQGQVENAQKQYQGFKARFETMENTCAECHGTDERKYYVDESIRVMVDELGKTIAGPSPEKVEKLVMGIGMESCHKCHLVHLPAAFAQKKWKK